MADPIRLYAEFTDDQGTDWRVNIHDSDYVGSAVEFNLGADGFVLRYSGNNEDRYQPVIGSEVTFTLTETLTAHETFMNLLAQNVEVRFSVSIRKDPDGTDDFWWGGVLLPEQVIRPYDAQPIQNTLTASDDLGNLQSIKYNNAGSAYTSDVSVVEHLLNCLNKTRATHLWGTDDFLYYINDFDSSDYSGTNQLLDSRIKHSELYNIENGENQYFDSYKVLSDLARVFNARVFQAEGKWWFLPVGAQKYSQTLTVEGAQKDGTAITQQSLTADKDFDSTFNRLNGYEYTYLAPLKTVSRTRRFDGNLPVIFDNLHTKAEFGTTLSDTDISYSQNSLIAVSGNFGFDRTGDGGSFGDSSIGRVLLRFTIKCGQYYLKRDVTFEGETQTFFLGNQLGVYTSHVYGAVSWETSLSYYNIVTDPFNEEEDSSLQEPFYIESPELPAASIGLDVTVDAFGRSDTGANEPDLVGTAADYGILNFRADPIVEGGLGDVVAYIATNSAAARADVDQGEVIFGDQESDNSIGVIRVYDGSDYVPTTAWQSLNFTGTGLSINRLGVQEALGGQNVATPIQRGDIFGSEIHMWQVIDDNTSNFAGDYALFELTFTARPVYTQVEAFRIDRDLTNITTAITDAEDTRPSIVRDPIVVGFGVREGLMRLTGMGFEHFGSRNQTVNRSIEHRDTLTSTVNDTDLHIVNSWAGPNGSASLGLPPIAESYGRIIQFHSDASISANSYVTLRPDSGDTGTTIDGASSYAFNRAYDGITILGHTDDNWYIIQKKEK